MRAKVGNGQANDDLDDSAPAGTVNPADSLRASPVFKLRMDNPLPLSRANYPLVRFWDKQEWEDDLNNLEVSSAAGSSSCRHHGWQACTSDDGIMEISTAPTEKTTATTGVKGGACRVLGINVSFQYLEDREGRMVDG